MELQEDMAIKTLKDSLDDWILRWGFQLQVPTTYTKSIRQIRRYNNGMGRIDRLAVR